MPRLGQIFLRLGAKKNKADEFYRRAFELPKSGLRHRVGYLAVWTWLHALAGSGSSTLQYFFRREVFLVGSHCPSVSEWIL
jgi:hypothetical protein